MMSFQDEIFNEYAKRMSPAEVLAQQEQDIENILCDLSIKAIKHGCVLGRKAEYLEGNFDMCPTVSFVVEDERNDVLFIMLELCGKAASPSDGNYLPAIILSCLLEIEGDENSYLEVQFYQGNCLQPSESVLLDTLYGTPENPLQVGGIRDIMDVVSKS